MFREHDVRKEDGTVAGMERVPLSAQREVSMTIRKMSTAINAPVATEDDMLKNREYLCLTSAMHAAVASLHCCSQTVVHNISPSGMQPLIAGAKRGSSRAVFMQAFRQVPLLACCVVDLA